MPNEQQPSRIRSGRFLKFLLLATILLCCGTFETTMKAQNAKCSQQTIDALETQSDGIRDWSELRAFYHRYRVCGVDDAEVTEGVSESVARLFADHWDKLPTARQLFQIDPPFEAFALAGLNITDSTDDLNYIDKLASTQCPINLHVLCGKIRKAIRTNK